MVIPGPAPAPPDRPDARAGNWPPHAARHQHRHDRRDWAGWAAARRRCRPSLPASCTPRFAPTPASRPTPAGATCRRCYWPGWRCWGWAWSRPQGRAFPRIPRPLLKGLGWHGEGRSAGGARAIASFIPSPFHLHPISMVHGRFPGFAWQRAGLARIAAGLASARRVADKGGALGARSQSIAQDRRIRRGLIRSNINWMKPGCPGPGTTLPPTCRCRCRRRSHPGTLQPLGPSDLVPIFPNAIIAQEMSTERYIDIPEPVRDVLCQWRPSPLFRARRLREAARYAGPDLLQVRRRLARRQPQAQLRGAPGLVQRPGRRQAPRRPKPAPASGVRPWRMRAACTAWT